MWSGLSFVACVENFQRQRCQRRQEPGDLLIEEVCGAGNFRPSRVGKGRDDDFFSALSAQSYVSGAFLFGKCGVNTVLSGEKGFRRRQCFGWRQCSGGLLKGAVAL